MRGHRIKAAALAVLFFLLTLSVPALAEDLSLDGKTLALRDCLALGLKLNPAGEISRQQLKAARERSGEAWAGYYPSARLSSSYTYTSPAATGMAASPDSYDNRLAVRQLLFDAGATAGLAEGIEHAIIAQQHELGKTELDLVANISAAFIEALKKEALLKVAQTSFDTAGRHLAQARGLYQEGLSPRSDVIKAELQLSNARLALVTAENGVLVAKATLAAAMGMSVTSRFALDGHEVAAMQATALPELAEARERAYRQRPELKGSRARIDSAAAAIRQARGSLYPNLSLDAAYGWQESTFVPAETKWSVGLSVGIPLFEQLTGRAKVAQAEAARDGLKAAELQAQRAVELEVVQAWLAVKEAQERLVVADKAVEQAGEDLRVSEGRYKEGVGAILELIDARTAVTQAGSNQVAAAYDIASAQSRLDRATGMHPVRLPEGENR